MVAQSRSSETFVALCLLTVVGASLITEQLGMSDTLGAFIAGVLLSETSFRTQVRGRGGVARGGGPGYVLDLMATWQCLQHFQQTPSAPTPWCNPGVFLLVCCTEGCAMGCSRGGGRGEEGGKVWPRVRTSDPRQTALLRNRCSSLPPTPKTSHPTRQNP
jgi:hypothetical protein